MKNNEHTLDTTVRQALENLEIPFNADHWELMAGKLDALNAEDADFDKNIASKLASVEVPYIATHWSDMSNRLDALDVEDTDFDALIRQRLDNVQPTMPDNHWALMEEKLEETFSWRRKIVRYKVVEVALILLTLFTVGNALDLPFDSVRSTDNNASPKIEATILKSKKDDLKKATPEKAKETKSFYNPTDWRNRPATPNNTPNKPIVATDNVNGSSVANPIAVQLVTNDQNESYNNYNNLSTEPAITESTAVVTSETGTNTEGTEMTELPMRKVVVLGKVTDGQEANQDVALIAATVLSPMDVLKPDFLNTQFYDENIVFPKSKDKRPKWRLNAFVLPIADSITSYALQHRDRKEQRQILANLGAGIAVGYKKGNLEVESGLSYLDKKYYLPNVEVITGNFARSYTTQKAENVHLSILSMPLSMNYAVKETRRWRFYTRIGAAFNTILKSEESQFATLDGLKSPVAPPANLDVYELNVYPKGITEKGFFKIDNWFKGNLRNNSYLTANAGLGIEYRLTNNVDIYFQPTLDYHFGRGIGTLNDRVHSFSVQGGVKTKLK